MGDSANCRSRRSNCRVICTRHDWRWQTSASTGDDAQALTLREAAAALRELVEERYWLDDDDFYAIALDGDKAPVRDVSSNPGQLLWSGLPSPDHARRTAWRLLGDDMFSGWGLRTLSAEHPGYNPLSYQRGSVWPHDTMLAAAGMFRYGLREEAAP